MPNDQPKKILVVDDNEGIRKSLIHILTHRGYDVGIATDGQDALSQLRQQSVDLVISDVEMSPMDGLTLLRTLHQDVSLTHIQVIIMSARDYERRAQVALDHGAQFVKKPLSLEPLLQAIQIAIHPD